MFWRDVKRGQGVVQEYRVSKLYHSIHKNMGPRVNNMMGINGAHVLQSMLDPCASRVFAP